MEDSFGCMYFDWPTIGTWVGGLGSAAAAGVAVWISVRESKRRADYAMFLWKRDVDMLRPFVSQLIHVAESRIRFEFLDQSDVLFEIKHEQEHDIWIEFEKKIKILAGKLEVFGRAERLFDLRERGVEFADVERAVNRLLVIDKTADELGNMFGNDAAAEEFKSLSIDLDKALKAVGS